MLLLVLPLLVTCNRNYGDNSSFDLRDSLLGSPFSCQTTQKVGNSNVLYYDKKNPVELKHIETLSSCRVFYLMKLRPQKERKYLIWNIITSHEKQEYLKMVSLIFTCLCVTNQDVIFLINVLLDLTTGLQSCATHHEV